MPQLNLNLPPITPKKAVVILGVLAVIIVFSFGAMNDRGGRQLLDLSGGDVGSYGVTTPGMAPQYDYAQENYGKGIAYRGEMGVAESSIAPMPPFPGPDSAPAGEEKIIKSATLSLLVENVDGAAAKINLVRTRFNGQIGNSTFSEFTSGSREWEITIWVPSVSFDEALTEIKKLALRVENETVAVSDVSAQFVDLDARLKNLRATELQYVEIMKRSGKLSEVLEVTRELSNTRAQIEQLEGQRNYLSRQVALSSIHVSLSQEASPGDLTNEWRPLAVIKAAAKETLSGFTDFIDGLLVFLIALPLLLLKLAFLALVVWVLWRIGRAAYNRINGWL